MFYRETQTQMKVFNFPLSFGFNEEVAILQFLMHAPIGRNCTYNLKEKLQI